MRFIGFANEASDLESAVSASNDEDTQLRGLRRLVEIQGQMREYLQRQSDEQNAPVQGTGPDMGYVDEDDEY